MRSELIQEDIFDLVDAAAKNVASARAKNKDTYLSGSISKYSKNLIMSFPAICDNTLPIDTVQLVSKAHEKNLATMFEMLFSAMSLSGNNGVEILKKIHKDLGGKTSLNDIIDSIEKLVGESDLSYTQRCAINQFIREAVADFKTPQKCFPVESLNEKSLADYTVKNLRGKILVSEAKPPVDPSIAAAKEKEAEYAENRERREEEKRGEERERNEREKERSAREKEKYEIDLAQMQKVRDIDYKKANELQPTVLVVNFTALDENGTKLGTKTFLAGVKSRVVGCDAIDIANRLVEKSKSKLSFKDFIRAATGEIKFCRDFLLRTKDMKKAAINDYTRKDSTTKMWKLLEKRARANVKGKLYKSNDASAITTLVLSKSTVDFIKASNKLDLLDPKTAASLMESFNLLAIVICDEISETAKFLYDGNNEYDTYSYSVLSKEASDKSYKKVIDLINHAGR